MILSLVTLLILCRGEPWFPSIPLDLSKEDCSFAISISDYNNVFCSTSCAKGITGPFLKGQCSFQYYHIDYEKEVITGLEPCFSSWSYGFGPDQREDENDIFFVPFSQFEHTAHNCQHMCQSHKMGRFIFVALPQPLEEKRLLAQAGEAVNGDGQDNGQPDNGQPGNGNGQPGNGNGQPGNGNGQPGNGNGQPDNGQPDNGQPDNGQPDNGQPDKNLPIPIPVKGPIDLLQGGCYLKTQKAAEKNYQQIIGNPSIPIDYDWCPKEYVDEYEAWKRPCVKCEGSPRCMWLDHRIISGPCYCTPLPKKPVTPTCEPYMKPPTTTTTTTTVVITSDEEAEKRRKKKTFPIAVSAATGSAALALLGAFLTRARPSATTEPTVGEGVEVDRQDNDPEQMQNVTPDLYL